MGLALLLLLSPCKVKNFIHAELGIPKTEISKTGKNQLNSSSCTTAELTESALTFSKQISQHASGIKASNSIFGFKTIEVSAPLFIPFQKRNILVSLTPYYILYQNFKVYSA